MNKKFIKLTAFLVATASLVFSFSCGKETNPTEIKNMVLIIGDGMGIEHITAGQLVENTVYPFTEWDFVSVNTDSVKTDGKGPVLTDSAAAGTALATGYLTVNGYVGKDYNGNDVKTILDYASEKGKSTGVVTTDYLHGATPGAFSAHSLSRNNTAELVSTQIKSGVNLLCGSYDTNCSSQEQTIVENGYAYCDDYSKIEQSTQGQKAYWLFDMAGTSASVKLEDVAENALDFLNKDQDGFVLMIEQAHIDKYSHSNDFQGMWNMVASLNRTVEAVKEWIGDRTDTAILITADHETGGLNVGLEDRYSKYVTIKNGGKKIYYNWSTGDHTNAKVGLFTYGITPDFESLGYYKSRHLIKNIDVFRTMHEVLTSPVKYSAFTA